jgi:hypothetical protein
LLAEEDEFLFYMKSKIDDHLVMSFDNTDLLLWGTRENSSVRLLRLTLTVGVKNPRIAIDNPHCLDDRLGKVMKVASLLSHRSKSTFFVILYPVSGGHRFVVTDPTDPHNWSKSFEVQETEMPQLVESSFKTNLGNKGTAKAVNKTTSDWFHDWARANLPKEYVRANVDGLITNKTQEPRILLETKRSFYLPFSWSPWQADSRNYYLQHILATVSGLSFWTIYHRKGVTVDDDTKVALFEISEVSLKTEHNWITYDRLNTSACEILKLTNERCSEDDH